jgi:excisionase family DNA binding protein
MQKLAWSLIEISKQTGLSVSFLRKEIRAGRLPIKRFGRRILVLDADLNAYLSQDSGATI